MKHFYWVLIACLLSTWCLADKAVQKNTTQKNMAVGGAITHARIWRAPDNTRLVLDLSHSVPFQTYKLSSPERIILDIPSTQLKTRLEQLPIANTHIRLIRTSQRPDGSMRLVMETSTPVQLKVFLLTPNQQYGHRLVLDFFDLVPVPSSLPTTAIKTNAPFGTKIPSAPQSISKTQSLPDPKPTVLPQTTSKPQVTKNPQITPPPLTQNPVSTGAKEPSIFGPSPTKPAGLPNEKLGVSQENNKAGTQGASKKRLFVVAIDAGHGGEDPGALSANGSKEKHITLSIARELARQLNKQPGFSAHLIRSGDYFIPLRKRTQIARSRHSDLFVSIHADAAPNRSAHGASVYALSERGASSESARWLAANENQSDKIGGVGGISLEGKDPMVAGVLLDMSMTSTISSSLQLGRHMLRHIGQHTKLHKPRVEQAGFMVLKSPDMPSLLVETGFISNDQEARRLADPIHQRLLASAILKGIVANYGRK